MISRSSRYRKEDIYTSNDPDRADKPISGVLPHSRDEHVVRREHRVAADERLDHLAHRYYGDPLLYWLICDESDVIFPEELLVPGRILRIPRNRR